MQVVQNIVSGFLVINKGNFGWVETYHLPALSFAEAAAGFLDLVKARAVVLARGCYVLGAGLKAATIPQPRQLLLTSIIPSLKKPDNTNYWDTVDTSRDALLLTSETPEGRNVMRPLRGVSDSEIDGTQWIRSGLSIPAVAPPPPAVPGLATKDELWQYALGTIRANTIYARPIAGGTGGNTLWETDSWDNAYFNGVGTHDTGRRFLPVSWESVDWTLAPAFSPCGTILGYLRSCYEAPCLFYADGLPGGIRWYFAKPTAKVNKLASIFWPTSQELQYKNTAGVGEFTGESNRVYSLGYAFGNAPGTSPTGTAADFLGLTLSPWQPPQPTPLANRPACDTPIMTPPHPIRTSYDDATADTPDLSWLKWFKGHFELITGPAGTVLAKIRTTLFPTGSGVSNFVARWLDDHTLGTGTAEDDGTTFILDKQLATPFGNHFAVAGPLYALSLPDKTCWHVNALVPLDVHGIVGGESGRWLILWITESAVTFKHDSGDALPVDRILTYAAEDITVEANNMALLQWDDINSNWRLHSNPTASATSRGEVSLADQVLGDGRKRFKKEITVHEDSLASNVDAATVSVNYGYIQINNPNWTNSHPGYAVYALHGSFVTDGVTYDTWSDTPPGMLTARSDGFAFGVSQIGGRLRAEATYNPGTFATTGVHVDIINEGFFAYRWCAMELWRDFVPTASPLQQHGTPPTDNAAVLFGSQPGTSGPAPVLGVREGNGNEYYGVNGEDAAGNKFKSGLCYEVGGGGGGGGAWPIW